jgi:exonuclease VII small subunit
MDTRPGGRPEPRCAIPPWLDQLRSSVDRDLAAARSQFRTELHKLDEMFDRLDEAEVQLEVAQRAFEPYRPSLDAAHHDVRSAQEAVWAANNQAMRAKGFKKRGLLREATKASTTLDDARANQADVEAVAAPAKNRVAEAKGSVHQIQNTIRSTQRQVDRYGHDDRILWLGDLDASLDIWERWASGRSVVDTDVIDAARCLREAATTSQADGWGYLATTVEEWGTKRGLKLAPTIEVAAPSVADGFGIEL